MLITTGATDNNEGYLYTNELFKFEANKSIVGVALIDFTEANTDGLDIFSYRPARRNQSLASSSKLSFPFTAA